MTDYAVATSAPLDAGAPPRLKGLQIGVLWLLGASGSVVFIEQRARCVTARSSARAIAAVP